jgi:hypothetical protein
MSMNSKRVTFDYEFILPGRDKTCFGIQLDSDSLKIIGHTPASKPAWTELDFEKCQCCTLTIDTYPHCPIALNIVELVDAFKDIVSYDDCLVRCITVNRTYSKETSVMEGLSSIFGIIMATSDCPVMSFLRPMARFHLPFSTITETTVRTTSLFLLRQYFEQKRADTHRLDFSRLEKHYKDVKLVNEGLLKRLKDLGHQDADRNAVVTLHSLSQFLSMEIDYNLNTIEHMFV